jgi:hypothetical protein
MNSFLYPIIGGLLIGFAAAIMMIFNGKIAGISGITRTLISHDCETNYQRYWRLLFLLGLIVGGFFIIKLFPENTSISKNLNFINMILGGLMVGIGTSFANGCTSGHGVCGLSRGSKRSFISVIIFMFFGVLGVLLSKLWS